MSGCDVMQCWRRRRLTSPQPVSSRGRPVEVTPVRRLSCQRYCRLSSSVCWPRSSRWPCVRSVDANTARNCDDQSTSVRSRRQASKPFVPGAPPARRPAVLPRAQRNPPSDINTPNCLLGLADRQIG